MAYKFNEGSTTTIDKPTETQQDVVDIVEKRVQENTYSEIQKEFEQFDNSHTASDLPKVYDEIDKQAVNNTATKKPANFINPFSGSDNALEELHKKSSYRDVVQKVDNPTVEIDAYSDKGVAEKTKSTSRTRLWIFTGVFCTVLLLTLVICNAFSIGNIERDINTSESALSKQEVELDALTGKISVETNTIPEGMSSMDSGTGVDITPTVDTEIVTSDNFFNKLAKFIAYLFGR